MNNKYFKYLLIFSAIFLFSHNKIKATHIVGGEFNLVHLHDSTYQLSLIQYFDSINGNANALDQLIWVHVYEKLPGTDVEVDSFGIFLTAQENVLFTNPSEECSDLDDVIFTKRILYQREIILSPSEYNNQDGYYVIWERCCRNNTIDNIIDPGGTGQTFYLEFPAVVDEEDEPFINSSPSLFEPLRDFACVDVPFKINFTGIDADGDSLVYSLSHPIKGFSSRDEPAPIDGNPEPYPLVDFRSGYSVNDMIHGNPSLTISEEGELLVVPNQTGLFVFSAKCEEFRDGIKIGEVVRDYQLLVVDNCDISPPIITLADTTFNSPPEGENALYILGEPGECIEFNIADSTSQDKLFVQVKAVGFDNISDNVAVDLVTLDSLPIPPSIDIVKGETLTYMACIKEECTGINFDTQYHFQLILGDNSCPANLYDTTDVYINIEVPRDSIPEIEIRDKEIAGLLLPYDEANDYYTAEVMVDSLIEFKLFGLDDNIDDPLDIRWEGVNFSLAEVGLDSIVTRIEANDENGVLFSWRPGADCLLYGEFGTDVFIDFIVDDIWECGVSSSDTARIKISVIFDNDLPDVVIKDEIDQEELPFTSFYFDSLNIGESLFLDIIGDDIDGDSVQIFAEGVGFNLEDVGMEFNTQNGPTRELPEYYENNPLKFQWIAPTCEFLNDNGVAKFYDVKFTVQDVWECGIRSSKDVILRIKLFYDPEPNSGPVMTPIKDRGLETEKLLTFDTQSNVFKDTLIIGDSLRYDVSVFDPDPDDYIRIVSANLNDLIALGMDIDIVEGITEDIRPTEIRWLPTCESLNVPNNTFEQLITFTFQANDPPFCFRQNASTITIELLVKMPENEGPEITSLYDEDNELSYSFNDTNSTFDIVANAGELIEFDFMGYDFDEDSVEMIITGDGFNVGNLGVQIGQPFYLRNIEDSLYKHKPFSWQTSCENLNGLEDVVYSFTVFIRDRQFCDFSDSKTYTLNIRIRDKPIDWDNLNFSNAFTPNDDDKNQTFFLDKEILEGMADLINDNRWLPENNCEQQFLKIEIYNRWGESIYESDDRKFQWEGKDHPAGVYFYVIYYTRHKYNGTVSLVK